MKKNILSVAVLTALVTSFNGCGNSSSNDKIDLAQYFEKDSRVNNMVRIYESSQYPEPTVTPYSDVVEVKDNVISHEAFGQPSFKVQINENDLNITNIMKNTNYLVKRYITLGEEISSHSRDATVVQDGMDVYIKETETCVMDDRKDSFTLEADDENLTYKGDLILQICTAIGTQTYTDLNTSFSYTDIYHEIYAKDRGRIVAINEDCLVPQKEPEALFYDIDDNSEKCTQTNTMYDLRAE